MCCTPQWTKNIRAANRYWPISNRKTEPNKKKKKKKKLKRMHFLFSMNNISVSLRAIELFLVFVRNFRTHCTRYQRTQMVQTSWKFPAHNSTEHTIFRGNFSFYRFWMCRMWTLFYCHFYLIAGCTHHRRVRVEGEGERERDGKTLIVNYKTLK